MSDEFKFPYELSMINSELDGSAGDDFLMLCSMSGRIIFMSGSLRLYVGEDLTGRNLNDFLEDELAARIVSTVGAGENCDFPCELRQSRFNCTAEPGNGRIKIWFYPAASGANVTMTSASARFISSEMNNSLNMLFASVSLLNDALNEDEASSMPLAVINQNLYKLLRLSRNMADCAGAYSSSHLLHLSEEDAAELCRELLERSQALLQKCGVSVETNIPDRAIPCCIDREKFSRVLLNLLSNAVLSSHRDKRITVTLGDSESELFLTVTDTGDGIPSETLAELFRDGGRQDSAALLSSSGFGLPLVKHFCELHGGRLMIMSQEHGGTSVRASFLKRVAEPEMGLHCPAPELAGHDLVLLELSSALDKEAFMR